MNIPSTIPPAYWFAALRSANKMMKWEPSIEYILVYSVKGVKRYQYNCVDVHV